MDLPIRGVCRSISVKEKVSTIFRTVIQLFLVNSVCLIYYFHFYNYFIIFCFSQMIGIFNYYCINISLYGVRSEYRDVFFCRLSHRSRFEMTN